MNSAVLILKENHPLIFPQKSKPPDTFTYPEDQSWQLLQHQPIAVVGCCPKVGLSLVWELSLPPRHFLVGVLYEK